MKAKIFLLFFYLTLTLSIYGQTYPGTQVSNPVRTYVQNDTKGVWVIGNGAPIFSPTAKMSQLYFDYMNQTGYFWNGSAWVAWTNDFLRTASNGLTEDGTDVKLGGDLDENTTIELDGFDFVIQGSGTLGFDITGDIALLSTGGVEIRPDGKFEVHTIQNIEVDATQDINIQTDDVINIQALNGGSIIADNGDFVVEATTGNVQINSPATTAGVVNGIAYKSDITNSVAVTDYGINTTTGGMADDGKVWTYNGTANEMELVTPMGVDGLAAGTGIAFSGAAPDITISATGDITPYTVTAPITLTGHDIGHTASGVTPATYGSQTAAAVVTVDATGHVTGATTTTIIPGVNTIGANQLTSGLRDSITLNNWNLLGNSGTLQATNFLGTTDARGLSFRTNNVIRQTIRADGQVGIGTIDPQSKLDINTDGLGVTQTTTSGLALTNNTAATAGNQQISPAIRWRSNGWKTNATAASQSVDFRAYVLPIQGTSAPLANFILSTSIAGGAYLDVLTVSSGGLTTSYTGFSALNTGGGTGFTSYGTGLIFNNSGRDVDMTLAGTSGKFRIVGTPTIEASVTDYVNQTVMSTINASVNSQVLNGQRINNTLGFGAFTGLTYNNLRLSTGFSPTSGTHTYSGLVFDATINQTGGANGITRGIYINPTLTAAADFRAIEVTAGSINVTKTITTPGTTGDQTINKLAGTVNIAAAGTTVTVTNSLVTANSIIMCTVQTNDTTAVLKNVVPTAGSFVINLNAATTAETAIAFFVIN